MDDTKKSVIIATVMVLQVIIIITAGNELTKSTNKVTNMHQNCLIYHEELPYNKAIATCSEILEGE